VVNVEVLVYLVLLANKVVVSALRVSSYVESNVSIQNLIHYTVGDVTKPARKENYAVTENAKLNVLRKHLMNAMEDVLTFKIMSIIVENAESPALRVKYA